VNLPTKMNSNRHRLGAAWRARTALRTAALSASLLACLSPTDRVFAQTTLSGAVNAKPIEAPQDAPKISAIEIKGNKALNREGIIGMSALKVGEPVTKAVLDQAVRNLISTGNFGAKHLDEPEKAVIISADVDATTNTAKVTIEVDENDVVNNFNITGSGPIKTQEVLSVIQTKPGLILNLNTIRTDIASIQKLYTDKGYKAQVQGEGFGINNNGIVDIPVVVAKIGTIKINGLNKTRRWVVTREMYDQKEGDYYNINKLQRAYTRIFNTDLFSDIQPAFIERSIGVVDITLNMEEKRTGQVGLSVGYSSRNNLVGRAEVGENNFMGKGQAISLMWEAGGLANRNSYQADFTEPWLDRKHTSLGVSVYDKVLYRFGSGISSQPGGPVAGTDTDYFETHTGGTVNISRPFTDTVRGLAGFRYDNVRVPSLSLNLQDAAVLQNGPLMVLTLRGIHNDRDYDQDPAVGSFNTVTADIGRGDLKPVLVNGQVPPGAVSGILNYTKLEFDSRRYFSPKGRRTSPKDRRTVFAVRLTVGASSGTLPFSEQYFVGGAESLRGYNEDRFWGKQKFLGSFEFRQPLANALTGVLFADAGDAWGGRYETVNFNGFEQHSGFSPSVGFGLGLRVVTPIGPIRIDQGFGREGAHTHFSIGHVF
jgi:outer membrane protein insertion porin family